MSGGGHFTANYVYIACTAMLMADGLWLIVYELGILEVMENLDVLEMKVIQ